MDLSSHLEYTPKSSNDTHSTTMLVDTVYLQRVLEQLVHPGHLRRDREIDGAVANLDDKSAADIGVNFRHNLELLALANVLRF